MNDILGDLFGTGNEGVLQIFRKEGLDLATSTLCMCNAATILVQVKKDRGVDLLPIFEAALMDVLSDFDDRNDKALIEAENSTDFLVKLSGASMRRNMDSNKEERRKVVLGIITSIKKALPTFEEALKGNKNEMVLD